MNIALTNDDGIQAPGLRAIYTALKKAGHTVYCVAPVTEQSAVGHAVTISMPLRIKEFKENGFEGKGVYGTPVDCVKLGLNSLIDEKIDLVISGINAGANVGPDILYSGTVSAATEGASMGYPSMAVSFDNFKPLHLEEQAAFAVELAENLPWNNLPARCVINVNFPDKPMDETKGLRVCPQTSAVWRDWYVHNTDPRGSSYWWLDGKIPPEEVAMGTDRDLLTEGYVTMTPLKFDFTDEQTMTALSVLNVTQE
ncbi:MAG: 5'/3'-nucleotidase SurE [Desulfovibrionales bacterium]|nr:5'/3'-nucleotidase SurE [Desulfovibrionales bacterium]